MDDSDVAVPVVPVPRHIMRGPAKERVLFRTISSFFDQPGRIEKLRLVLVDKRVSLRRLEKSATACHTLEQATTCESYRAWLRSYGKKYFDTFARSNRARSNRISFRDMNTTLAQLNFLRWALIDGLVDRVIANNRRRDDIEDDIVGAATIVDDDDDDNGKTIPGSSSSGGGSGGGGKANVMSFITPVPLRFP